MPFTDGISGTVTTVVYLAQGNGTHCVDGHPEGLVSRTAAIASLIDQQDRLGQPLLLPLLLFLWDVALGSSSLGWHGLFAAADCEFALDKQVFMV
jgi:hypothetical protein